MDRTETRKAPSQRRGQEDASGNISGTAGWGRGMGGDENAPEGAPRTISSPTTGATDLGPCDVYPNGDHDPDAPDYQRSHAVP